MRPVTSTWADLLEGLGTLGSVTDRQPDGVTVVLSGDATDARSVEIVMAPDQWDDLVAIPFGRIDHALDHVCDLLRRQPAELQYLVYETYRLEPSATPSLSSELQMPRADDLSRVEAGSEGGWFAFPPEHDAG